MIPGSANSLLLASAAEAVADNRSLRFNSADSAYLSRTFGSGGNRKKWTWSGWVKFTGLAAQAGQTNIFGAYGSGTATTYHRLFIYEDKLYFSNGSNDFTTRQVFRDYSAWYHIVLAFDTTQTDAADREIFYINGVRVDTVADSTLSFDTEYGINNASLHNLGRIDLPSPRYSNIYLADVHFLDGITPGTTTRVVNGVTEEILTDFGEFDATTGVWNPIEYTGSFPGNSFHLDFADNSSTTSGSNVGIGKDVSGNGNYWNSTNISVTAGTGNDSLRDSPTNGDTADDTGAGGQVPGNYCTLNPLFKTGAGTPAYSNGNLDLSAGGSGDSYFAGTFLFSTGKYYYEATINAVGNGVLIGVCRESDSTSLSNRGSYRESGAIYNLDNTTQTSGSSYTTGDVIGVAVDCDNGEVQFYKNGVSQGATPSFTFTAGTNLIVRGRSNSTGASLSFNFGARAFSSSAPSGYKALCTANLDDPLIEDGSTAMDVVTYTGTGSELAVTGLTFAPDFVWVKPRSQAASHGLYDVLRGNDKRLSSNQTAAEGTVALELDSNGFTVQGSSSYGDSGVTYVGWCWDGGSSTVSNTDGSITSSVRANATAGFSVVTATGSSASTATVGHGLGVSPELIIVKLRVTAGNGFDQDWQVYHKSIGNTGGLKLNTTASTETSSNIWNNTSPTSTVFSIGASSRYDGNFVAYCFAPVEGYSAFGSYVGNGSTDGPFVYTGFRPRWVLIKNTTSSYDWRIHDTARDPGNVSDTGLFASGSYPEADSAAYAFDINSNGFKLRTADIRTNESANTYIYYAVAEHPLRYARAR